MLHELIKAMHNTHKVTNNSTVATAENLRAWLAVNFASNIVSKLARNVLNVAFRNMKIKQTKDKVSAAMKLPFQNDGYKKHALNIKPNEAKDNLEMLINTTYTPSTDIKHFAIDAIKDVANEVISQMQQHIDKKLYQVIDESEDDDGGLLHINVRSEMHDIITAGN